MLSLESRYLLCEKFNAFYGLFCWDHGIVLQKITNWKKLTQSKWLKCSKPPRSFRLATSRLQKFLSEWSELFRPWSGWASDKVARVQLVWLEGLKKFPFAFRSINREFANVACCSWNWKNSQSERNDFGTWLLMNFLTYHCIFWNLICHHWKSQQVQNFHGTAVQPKNNTLPRTSFYIQK